MPNDGTSLDGPDEHGGTRVPGRYDLPDERFHAALAAPLIRSPPVPLRRSTRVASGLMSVLFAGGSVMVAVSAAATLLDGGVSAVVSDLGVFSLALTFGGVSWLFYRAARTGFDPLAQELFLNPALFRRLWRLPPHEEWIEPPAGGRDRLPPP